jgi:hypothetical protein
LNFSGLGAYLRIKHTRLDKVNRGGDFLKYKKTDDRKASKMRAENEKRDKKIPDMYKRDDSPEQNGEDF